MVVSELEPAVEPPPSDDDKIGPESRKTDERIPFSPEPPELPASSPSCEDDPPLPPLLPPLRPDNPPADEPDNPLLNEPNV